MYDIYQIKNKITFKKYIGSSSQVEIRWKRHLNDLIKNQHHCTYLQRSFNKYSKDAFVFEILYSFTTKEEMLQKESELLNTESDLYNISLSASGGDLITNHPNYKSICEKHRENYYKNIDSITGKNLFLDKDNSGVNNSNYKHRKLLHNFLCCL